METRTAVAAFLVGLTFLFSGCSNSVLHVRRDVSRTTTWVRVADPASPFTVSDVVGGEHITRYRLLGFEGERYRITGSGEGLYMDIDPGPSAVLSSAPGRHLFDLEIIGMDALVTIEVSSSDFVSTYHLAVENKGALGSPEG